MALVEYTKCELKDELKRRKQCKKYYVCYYCGCSFGNNKPCKVHQHDIAVPAHDRSNNG